MTSSKPDEAGSQAEAEKYSFSLEDSHAIVRVTAYHRQDIRRAVISLPSSDVARFRSSLTSPNENAPSSSLGTLRNLPLEVLLEILRHVDISSLFAFRRVNRQARQVVATMHGYQSILKHAPCAFWVILRTEMSSWYTIDSLSALMGMRDCELCKSKSKASFAGFLFLPTFTRCCFSCVCYDERLTLVTLANATRQAVGMTYDKLRRVVPVLKMFPGKYCMEQVSSRQKVRLVSLHAMRRYIVHPHDLGALPFFRYTATTALPFVNARSKVVEHGVSCKGCQVALERRPLRTPVNYYNSRLDLYSRRNAVYSEEGFLEHFRYCEEAQALWESSARGTASIEEPEFTRQNGHVSDTDAVS